MKTQTYRLLNEGEAILEGDEFLYQALEMGWFPTSKAAYNMRFNSKIHPLYRRPIENQWIALSDRNPTKEDGRQVLVRYKESGEYNILFYGYVSSGGSSATHWCRIPEFHEEDPFEEWERTKSSGGSSSIVDHLKSAFNAGRDYEKGKK